MLYIVDRNHQRSLIVVDHSRNFKGIQLMSKSSQDNQQQTVPKQFKSEVEESGIACFPKPGNWTLQQLYLKINTNSVVGSMLDRISLKKLYI